MTSEEDSWDALILGPFRDALDRLSDAIAIMTAAEFPFGACIVYVNPALVRLSGYAKEQLVGHSSLLLAGARPDLRHVGDVMRATRGDTVRAVTRKFRPDGAAYDVEMWLWPLMGADARSRAATHYVLRERDLAALTPASGAASWPVAP